MYLRNYIAGLLLALLIAPQLLWLGAPDPESSLPPCCRRDGKHHCAMMAEFLARQQVADEGVQVGKPAGKCPFRSQLFPPVTSHGIGLPAQSLNFSGLIAHYAGIEQVRALARISESRSHQKRGPPINIPS